MEGLGVLGAGAEGDAAPARRPPAQGGRADAQQIEAHLHRHGMPGEAALWHGILQARGQVRKHGAVGETRTRDRRFRKPLLYPAELPPLIIE
jgi:hypothetical protein